MLRDFGMFIALVCLFISIVIILGARWIVHCIDNNKDLENKMVGKIKVVSTLVSFLSLFIIAILIK